MNISGDRRRLSSRKFTGGVYENADLRGALAIGTLWENCSFDRCKFGQADFTGASFINCRFVSCDFSQARLVSTFDNCWFAQVNFDQAQIVTAIVRESSFTRCRFQYASFFRSVVENASFIDCDLHGANLDMAASTNIDFSGSNFWAAVIPLNCAMVVGNTFDRDQIHRLMALLLHANGDWKDEIAAVVDSKARRLVGRLVNAATESVGEGDGDRTSDGGRSDAEMGLETPPVGRLGDSSEASRDAD